MVQKQADIALVSPMNNNAFDYVIKLRPLHGIIYFLVVVLACLPACAAAPPSPHLYHPSLSLRKPAIKTVGLLPPMISMYEEHYAFGKNIPILQKEWSKAARESLITACTAAAAANGWTLVILSTDDPELKDMAQLYYAVDFSILRHARDVEVNSRLADELFPEKFPSFDYTLGPSQGVMERHGVDAVWIVRGFNLVPSSGIHFGSVTEGALYLAYNVLMTAGMVATGGMIIFPGAGKVSLQELGLSSALVDRSGSILSYSIFNKKMLLREERTGTPPVAGELEPIRPAEPTYPFLDNDLRDPRVAGHYMKAALAGYAAGARP